MATATESTTKKKTVDLPPKGSRNTDPISGAAGAHPIEAGIGAAAVGAAAGLAVGALGGPVGAVIGAAVGGAVAGGYAGKGVGELIDPTTEEKWLIEFYRTHKPRKATESHDTYRSAYRYGLNATDRCEYRPFESVEADLHTDWERARTNAELEWEDARPAIRHAYDRASDYRRDQSR